MSKSIKLQDDTYIDSTGVVHNRDLLSDILTDIDSLLTTLSVDYIVEQNTSGNWTYRKWASGLAECWCNQTCTGLTLDRASAGTYYSDNQGQKTFNYPTNLFISVTNVMVAIGQGSHSSGLYPYQAKNGTGTTSCTIEFRSFASCTNANCPVYIHAYGRWK